MRSYLELNPTHTDRNSSREIPRYIFTIFLIKKIFFFSFIFSLLFSFKIPYYFPITPKRSVSFSYIFAIFFN